ncbi:helix-turn-helix domain-containing protein [Spirosoma sp. KUDC1026]|uniref:helix-turn-helix domain-containing protein n=1 Tax=Spirosoma sp. KUDC1026 TaxID=2745947 RepID=UPI00159B9B4C|nr:helix-turn-helix domain-containing protein [Spirosoma sp. KUDC1026]QKZ13859.1 helix-turn-helix domain-containing protein [Spirosoma sp. KUDC1026]
MKYSVEVNDYPVHDLPNLHFLAADQGAVFGDHRSIHRINFYAIVWFLENGGLHYVDFEPFPIRKDDVYLIGSNQLHAIPSATVPKARVIVFSSEFFDRIEEFHFRQLFLPIHNEGTAIPPDMVQPLHQLFELIVLEYKGRINIPLLLKYTTAFLTHIYRFRTENPAIALSEDHRVIHVLRLLEENFKEHHSATFYAKELGLTPKRINELLRQQMNTTISQLVYTLLLAEAKRTLFHHELSIKEIAYDLGFTNQSYFARFFRKYTGMAPEKFRAHAADMLLTA